MRDYAARHASSHARGPLPRIAGAACAHTCLRSPFSRQAALPCCTGSWVLTSTSDCHATPCLCNCHEQPSRPTMHMPLPCHHVLA